MSRRRVPRAATPQSAEGAPETGSTAGAPPATAQQVHLDTPAKQKDANGRSTTRVPADATMAQHAADSAAQRRGRAARTRQIIEILSRNGLGFLVGSLSAVGHMAVRSPAHGGKSRPQKGRTPPERFRQAIEELGPTFIKLGQILSTRGDLLPQPYLDELAKLQDSAPPVPSEQIRAILHEELERPLEEVFASFDMTPLASASIGQAHAATLADGTDVVVKLRRPGVVEQVDEDLHILLDLALKASRHWRAARDYDLLAIAYEFAQTLRAELDYLREGRNVERIATNFRDEPSIHIPAVYWKTTTARMLTLEHIHGVKITQVATLAARGIDRTAVSHLAARLLLTMILEHGFFHADPHPGNVLVEPDGRIGLIDFGMVGQVDEANRDLLVRLMISISTQDASQLADVLLQLGRARGNVDRNALRRDLQLLLARYAGRPLGDVKVATMLAELLDVIRWHHLRLAPDMALLVKTLAMGEGLGVQLDPSFDLMEVYIPLASEIMRKQFSVRNWTRQLMLAGIDAFQMSLELPAQLRRVLGDIERGGFEVSVQPASFEPYLARMEQYVNRIALALLAATFTLSGAMLVAAFHPARWDVVAALLFLLVVLLSTSFGGYVLMQILSARRRRPDR